MNESGSFRLAAESVPKDGVHIASAQHLEAVSTEVLVLTFGHEAKTYSAVH